MRELLQNLLQWMVGSTAFKKVSGIVGGFTLGMWVSMTYWKQILDTCTVWGVTPGSFKGALIWVVGTCGVCGSVGLSIVKAKQDKADAAEADAIANTKQVAILRAALPPKE